jgi:hypothetical protein
VDESKEDDLMAIARAFGAVSHLGRRAHVIWRSGTLIIVLGIRSAEHKLITPSLDGILPTEEEIAPLQKEFHLDEGPKWFFDAGNMFPSKASHFVVPCASTHAILRPTLTVWTSFPLPIPR